MGFVKTPARYPYELAKPSTDCERRSADGRALSENSAQPETAPLSDSGRPGPCATAAPQTCRPRDIDAHLIRLLTTVSADGSSSRWQGEISAQCRDIGDCGHRLRAQEEIRNRQRGRCRRALIWASREQQRG